MSAVFFIVIHDRRRVCWVIFCFVVFFRQQSETFSLLKQIFLLKYPQQAKSLRTIKFFSTKQKKIKYKIKNNKNRFTTWMIYLFVGNFASTIGGRQVKHTTKLVTQHIFSIWSRSEKYSFCWRVYLYSHKYPPPLDVSFECLCICCCSKRQTPTLKANVCTNTLWNRKIVIIGV